MKTISLLVILVVAIIWRSRLGKTSTGTYLRGLKLITADKLNAELHGWAARMHGIWIGKVIVPYKMETQHFLITGKTRSGKSSLIRGMLQQIEARGQVAVVIDPDSEFVQEFYDESRGDVILNPLDARCPFWSPWLEMRRESFARDAASMAGSLVRQRDDPRSAVFADSARVLLSVLLETETNPTEFMNQGLAAIQKQLQGTRASRFVDPRAVPQSAAIMMSAQSAVGPLSYLPRVEDTSRSWNALEWAQERKGWVFLSSNEETMAVARPLQGVWLDCIGRALMSAEIGAEHIWLVCDEFAALGYQPRLEELLIRGAKRGICVVLGIQNVAQVRSIYGHDNAVTMLSSPTTKIILPIDEPESVKWLSALIGEQEQGASI